MSLFNKKTALATALLLAAVLSACTNCNRAKEEYCAAWRSGDETRKLAAKEIAENHCKAADLYDYYWRINNNEACQPE